MALAEWERENARREAEWREKDNAKQIRRQTEILQRTAAAQRADMEHAALMREEGHEAQMEALRAAQKAARSAERAEELARTQLAEQRDHNFAMWRQTTANGAAYEEWATRAVPLIEELVARDARWSPARDADIEAHSAAVAAEVLGRHGLDSPRFARVNQKTAPTVLGLILSLIFIPTALSAVPAGIWWLVTWVASWFHADWPWQGFVYPLIFGLLAAVYCPIEFAAYRAGKEWHVHGKESLAEIEKRKAAFEASIPTSWQDESGAAARQQLRAAAATIDSMPTEYTAFHPGVLTELPAVPAPVAADAIDEQATGVHALLKEWAPAPVVSTESAH